MCRLGSGSAVSGDVARERCLESLSRLCGSSNGGLRRPTLFPLCGEECTSNRKGTLLCTPSSQRLLQLNQNRRSQVTRYKTPQISGACPKNKTFILIMVRFIWYSKMGNKQNTPPQQNAKVFSNSSIISSKKKFMLEDSHIQQLFDAFSKIDVDNKGHITCEDIREFLHKKPNSIVMPALTRLFSLMSADSERLFFEEWVDGVMVFNLYNKESLVRFIFDILDTDQDGFILKKEILKYVDYKNPLTGQPVFHTNFLEPIESLELTKFYLISFDDFRKICDQYKFLCWPAIKLQQDFKDIIMGPEFWEKIYSKIEKRESEIKNNNKKDNAIEDQKKKLQQKNRLNASKFQQFIKTRKIERNLFKPKLGQRHFGEIGSDTKLCFHAVDSMTKTDQMNSHLPLKKSNSTIYIKVPMQ